MKAKSGQIAVLLILALGVSCDDPITIVTNIVHEDGSVTRRIEMKIYKKPLKLSDAQVPYDSTWTMKDSISIDKKGDTTWIKTVEKYFRNTAEINLSYKNDSSSNRGITRLTKFKKSFRWFNTEYRFSEMIEKRFSAGYPVSNFLNEKELKYFYTPESFKNSLEQGKDSLIYRALKDTVNKKTDKWMMRSLVSECCVEFSKLTEGKGGKDLELKKLKENEDRFMTILEKSNDNLDSLWKNGIILRQMIGDENALKFKDDADTVIEKITKIMLSDFKGYSVRISMPGKVIDSNGFIDSSSVLLWPVRGEYFLTEPYEMYAESRVSNIWAWVVSGGFVLFVIVGLVVRKIKRG